MCSRRLHDARAKSASTSQCLSPCVLWKRFFSHSSAPPSFPDLTKGEKKDVEWIAELFRASIFSENASFGKLRVCQLSYKQTQILATLVPDEIIHFKDLRDKSMTSFVGVLLFADVSGFTALCEKYSKSGKGGTYRLTATLNKYIGSMVEVIYSYGGDVLNFAGDAFLALWKVKPSEYINHIIHNAIACGLFIQQVLGSYETDVKVLLKVKIAISAGNILFSILGDEICQQFIVCGTPVEDVNAAEQVCSSGDVILSPSAWGHCSPHNYEFSLTDDGNVKVTRIIYNPKVVKKEVIRRFIPLSIMLESRKTQDEDRTVIEISSTTLPESNEKPIFHENVLRPSVNEACKEQIGSMLRPFMIPPVVQQIDAGQPLQYLTEMRQVTTMFINLVAEKVSFNILVRVVDEAYTTIYKEVRSALGCVNKVTMFDKDITFLVIFGLRGCKYESDSENGLKCAYSILDIMKNVKHIQSISAGVTTGMVYCGVVGHNVRREYTVIGAPVNKAARLMCAYHGQVTCDNITAKLSKMPPENFELQEVKILKGIDLVGKVYKYLGSRMGQYNVDRGRFTFVGRNNIILLFENMLKKFKNDVQYNALVIRGDTQMGKTCLLNELIWRSKSFKFIPIPINLNSMHFSMPYTTIFYIMKEILDINDSSSLNERTESVLGKMNGYVSRKELCYLNEIMQVKFPHSIQYLKDSPESRLITLSRILQNFIEKCSEKFIVAVDDAHFMDSNSWQLLVKLVPSNSFVFVATIYNGHRAIISDTAQMFLAQEKVQILQLDALPPDCIQSIACQFLNVRAISTELDRFLSNYGMGNPGWCQAFLTSMMYAGSLRFQEMTMDELLQNQFILTEGSLPESSDKKAVQCSSDEPNSSEGKETTVPVCMVRSNFHVNRNAIPQSIDAMIMAIFDSLTPYEQLLVKCASVLGDTFSRTMLSAVMHDSAPEERAEAVKRLFELKIFDCIFSYERRTSEKGETMVSSSLSNEEIICSCPESRKRKEQMGSGLPKYSFCQALHFKMTLFRITTYELLPVNQKRYFHGRSVKFLEEEERKCISCGGKGLFIISPQNAENMLQSEEGYPSRKEMLRENTVLFWRERLGLEHRDLERSSIETLNSDEADRIEEWEDASYFDERQIRDFSKCECPLVDYHIYEQLVYHSRSAGLTKKQIYFMTQQASASILIGNNTHAIKLLKKAKNLIERTEIEEDINLANIHRLLGQAHLDIGDLHEAKINLIISAQKYKVAFPKSKIVAQLAFLPWHYFSLEWLINHPHTKGNGSHYSEKAKAFSHLTNFYMMEEQWTMAEVAALISLNLSLLGRNFICTCDAYSNMIEICHHYRRLKYSRKLERSAMNVVKFKYSGSDANELQSVCHLFWAITVSRLLRGELTSSLKMGLLTMKISENLRNNFIILTILPTLIQQMVMSGRLHEAADLLQVLLFEAQADVDKSSEIWYYALCFDILLDTGFSIETAQTCVVYGQRLLNNNKEKVDNLAFRDKTSIHRLSVSMWIWYIRMSNVQLTREWGNIVIVQRYNDDSFSDTVTSLRFLEGLLLSTVIDLQLSQKSILRCEMKAEIEIMKLETISEVFAIIQPRLFHLKAYYLFLIDNKSKGMEYLSRAKQIAEQQNNVLEIGWITHSSSVWKGKINSLDEHLWEEVAFEAVLGWHDYKPLANTSYSLPIRNILLEKKG